MRLDWIFCMNHTSKWKLQINKRGCHLWKRTLQSSRRQTPIMILTQLSSRFKAGIPIIKTRKRVIFKSPFIWNKELATRSTWHVQIMGTIYSVIHNEILIRLFGLYCQGNFDHVQQIRRFDGKTEVQSCIFDSCVQNLNEVAILFISKLFNWNETFRTFLQPLLELSLIYIKLFSIFTSTF